MPRGDCLEIVVLTAFGVGGATVLGAAIGFLFKGISHSFSDMILSFAAGVMLSAAVWGLIDPALEFGAAMVAAGVMIGGIAAGVGFGTGDFSQALTIAGGIALQNIPEGMVIIGPMLAVGIPKGKTFFCALISGLFEVFGTFLGFYAVKLAIAILPFALSFAGGTMLYVIADEMIPDTHKDPSSRKATYAFLIGFCFTVIFNELLA